MTHQNQLPLGDRDPETEVPRKGERPSEFVERLAADVAPPAIEEPRAGSCLCRERGWQCRHEPSYEERLEQIFRGGRQPGEDG